MTSASASPLRIACSASSASSRRRRNDSISLRSSFFPDSFSSLAIFSIISCDSCHFRFNIEAQENPVLIREIADKQQERKGKLFDQRRGGDDLILFGKLRLLINIAHFQFIPPF